MSLNGNLEVFPLEEVLRLLARSRKSGCLRVESAGVQGRIFLTNGALAFATTASDVELRRRLVSSRLVEEEALRKVELSGASVSDSLAPDVGSTEWADFVREESVEGLYRIRRTGRGTFDFVVELAPRYPTGQTFDSEVVLSEADRRSLEWEDIRTVLPELDKVVRMVPILDHEDTVTLSPSTWQILAALEGGSSTAQVAQRIGWSEFRTAREVATLLRNGLVTLTESRAPEVGVGAAAPEAEEVDQALPEEAPPEEAPEEPEAAEEVSAAVELEAEPHFEAAVEAEPEVVESVEAGGPVEHEEFAEASEFEEADESPAMIESQEEQRSSDAPAIDEPELEAIEAEVHESAAGSVAVDDAAEATDDLWGGPDVEAEPEVEANVEADTPDQPAEAVEGDSDESDDAASGETSSWWSDEPLGSQPAVNDEPETPWGSSPWTADTPSDESVIKTSPWGAPVGAVDTEAESEAAEPIAEPSEPEPEKTRGWWAETMGAAEEGHADTDTEADRFLESVFSSLSDDDEAGESKPEKEEDETGFGMGLLRRRRMGAAARDISENDR